MVIAIYGLSAVGKSTVSRHLHCILRWPVRHCGDEIKKKSLELGIQPHELSKDQHKEIDQESRAFAMRPDRIIEGRFLPEVLFGVKNVYFVELVCSDCERKTRHQKRAGANTTLFEQDEFTKELREKLYVRVPDTFRADMVLNTQNSSAEESAAVLSRCAGIGANDSI